MRPPELSPTRSLARLYSSTVQRPVLAALSSLEREIGVSLRPGLDHQVAHTRLAWWREECDRTARGSPAHPLTRELAALLAPLVTAPAWLFGSVASGYRAAQTINACVVSLAALPVYVLARTVRLSRPLALVGVHEHAEQQVLLRAPGR